ncbi:MAG TPA: SMC family ATPase, partial [Trueperaceae bacterium]
MRPIRLELHNFGPYLGEHVIDFETLGRHGLFLIHGPTGAGKSCILDGLCFALFGKASGDERSGSDLASTLQEEERCKVVLEFEHRGKRYRITRSPQQQMAKQRGEGKTTKQAEATLEALDDGEVLATKVGEADNVVKDLLRCSVEQFRQTVVLPQGAFREVITNDGERREILANIFDTRRFADFSEALNEKAKELAQQSQSMQSRRAELLAGAGCENDEQLARRLELAEAEAARLKEELAQAATVRDERLREKTEAAALDEQFEEAEELRKAQNELDQRAEEMKFERERLDRAKRAALLADARTYLETTRKEREGLQGEVEGATGRLEEARSQLVEATRRLEEEKAREAERKEAQAACGRLEALEKQVGELADIGRQESELAGQVEELAEQAEMRREAVGAAEEQRTELVQRRASLAEKLGSEADLERRRGELQAQVRALREIERELARVASLAEEMEEVRAGGDPAEHLILAVREHSPGLLAASLAEGEACPVCGSEHHPLPAEGHDGLGGLQAAFERFGEAREEVSRLEEAERQHSVRASNLAAEGGWTLESLPELAERVEALGEVERAQEETRALREQLDELDQAVAAIDEELPGLRGQVEEAQRQQNEATGKLRELRGRLKGLLDQLEPENRDPEAFGEALERSRSRHRELQEAYESAREGEQKAQAQVEKREAELSIRQGQLGTAAEKLARLEEEFAEKLRGHGFDGLEEL